MINPSRPQSASPLRRLGDRLKRFEQASRPLDPERRAVLAERWNALPESVRTAGQIIGRRSVGCEGTHGVFPACDFACKPCYHSADANRVQVDGVHTLSEIANQMAYFRARHGPAAYAQLIGGEVSLLDADDHAAAIETMRAHGRVPMSFSHGDFDGDYLRSVVLRPDGTRRFDHVSFAVHIDTTMRGRRGAEKPQAERELNPFRERACAMFDALRRDHGIGSYLAHNVTVTPANLGQIAELIADCKHMGFRMFSFQPAAYVGDKQRWDNGYAAMTDDAVWAEIERGVGRPLPTAAMQMGDLRCNRVTWGVFAGDRYVPVFEDDCVEDLRARDALNETFPGGWLGVPATLRAVKAIRGLIAHPATVPIAVGWAARFVRRAGGLRILRSMHPVTFVMHSFIDAETVKPAWELLQRGNLSDEPTIRAAQERLQACAYTMAHPETDELVPACVQHAVLDPGENRQLVKLLPRRRPSTIA